MILSMILFHLFDNPFFHIFQYALVVMLLVQYIIWASLKIGRRSSSGNVARRPSLPPQSKSINNYLSIDDKVGSVKITMHIAMLVDCLNNFHQLQPYLPMLAKGWRLVNTDCRRMPSQPPPSSSKGQGLRSTKPVKFLAVLSRKFDRNGL